MIIPTALGQFLHKDRIVDLTLTVVWFSIFISEFVIYYVEGNQVAEPCTCNIYHNSWLIFHNITIHPWQHHDGINMNRCMLELGQWVGQNNLAMLGVQICPIWLQAKKNNHVNIYIYMFVSLLLSLSLLSRSCTVTHHPMPCFRY